MMTNQITFLLSICITALLLRSVLSSSPASSIPPHSPGVRRVVIGVDGGTESIRAACFDAVDGRLIGLPCAVPYPTYHPQPGWAEQDPNDWFNNLGQAVREAVASIPKTENLDENYEICAICIDTTCCSVVVLDKNLEPLRKCLLWMDARSAPQTKEIMDKCHGDPSLGVNCGGEGPLSAEWMTPKALWVRQNEPHLWEQAQTICEYQDYINYKLTGILCASSCNAASRWHWDGEACLQEPGVDGSLPGRPISLYETLGIPELANKLPRLCLPPGATVGTLTTEAANHLSLPPGLPVAQGGADAFIGMIGLGCIKPGQLCLITGSSHLHCVVSSQPSTAPGTWGAYRGAPLPGINFAEGGQSSTGSILRWAKTKLFATSDDFKTLDREASSITPGCDGLVCIETFQGARTPVTDPLARGAFLGLTLSHTRAHVWRAVMEGVCFGTRACIDALAKAGHTCDEIVIAGGATRSPLWLQMHADVTGRPVVVCQNTDAPLLGCAILASVAAGVHDNVESAAKNMVRKAQTIEPDPMRIAVYDDLYQNVYAKIGPMVRVATHATIRGGSTNQPEQSGTVVGERSIESQTIISPSLLACDWASIKQEIQRCMNAGMSHFHVDIFDGVFLDSPHAFTFGPRMVKAIRQSCDEAELVSSGRRAVLDLHMCVDRPNRFVEAMAQAGADRFIFQWEAFLVHNDQQHRVAAALELAQQVTSAGMRCGVSVNPNTNIAEIFEILQSGLIDSVDVLAVEPGFGGQSFQRTALDKVASLRKWRDEQQQNLIIMVDGGINKATGPDAMNAGADVLVSGTFLFDHDAGMLRGANEILGK